MARPIVLSNGRLHVGLNNNGQVHDFYFPYVGLENHSAGNNLRHQIGVWVDGQISWVRDIENDWSFKMSYHECALMGHIIATNEKIGVILEFDDFVDAKLNVFIRNIHIVNRCDRAREIRLFMHQAFAIGDSRSNTDTAQFLPDTHAILHYRGRRAFVISGEYNQKPFDQYTVGLFGIEGREGTYIDATDGELSGNNVEHGRVDSTIRFSVNVQPNSSERVYYWIAAGVSTKDALDVHRKIKAETVMHCINTTTDWWYKWLEPARNVVLKIPKEYRTMFLNSIMIIKSQMDEGGGVIASTDTSMLNYSRDAYAYSWPRDAAYAIWPLIRMGYKDEAINFFNFTKRGLHSDGYTMHKYRADGALGSSWHPYEHENGLVAPPIQEDETALPLYIFAQFYNLNKDRQLLEEFYKPLVEPMANFLADYVDHTTGLPRPTYDLWERIFITSTYTTAVTYAALLAASDLADVVGDEDGAVKWRTAAGDIQEAAQKHLYNKDKKVFRRGLVAANGKIDYDDVVDVSSVFGAYIFGLFAPESEEILSSIATIKQMFGINQGAPGLPRYEGDDYRRVSPGITGNYWYNTSLWLAQYYLGNAETDKALQIINWVKVHSLSTFVMGEQIDPITNEIISPAPLIWTHAELVSTLLDLISGQEK